MYIRLFEKPGSEVKWSEQVMNLLKEVEVQDKTMDFFESIVRVDSGKNYIFLTESEWLLDVLRHRDFEATCNSALIEQLPAVD